MENKHEQLLFFGTIATDTKIEKLRDFTKISVKQNDNDYYTEDNKEVNKYILWILLQGGYLDKIDFVIASAQWKNDTANIENKRL